MYRLPLPVAGKLSEEVNSMWNTVDVFILPQGKVGRDLHAPTPGSGASTELSLAVSLPLMELL